MKEMSLDEIKECSKGILNYISVVCRTNHLQYFLCGGTLLGAIRHQGFIPWDDDIDIMMPRDDYERLFKVWPKDGKYALLNYKNMHNLPYAYGKAIDPSTIKNENIREACRMIGVDVDIFPIDGLPDDDKETEEYYLKIEKMQKRLSMHLASFGKGPSLLKTITRNTRVFLLRLSELLGITSVYKVTKKFDKLAQKYNQTKTNYCGITAISHYGIKEKNPKSNYEKETFVIFENAKYPAPISFNDYLARLYGDDYMQLPPENKRITHHNYKAYWK